jgi:hypothetical protein
MLRVNRSAPRRSIRDDTRDSSQKRSFKSHFLAHAGGGAPSCTSKSHDSSLGFRLERTDCAGCNDKPNENKDSAALSSGVRLSRRALLDRCASRGRGHARPLFNPRAARGRL